MKKKYILLKDTPELIKGAILEEQCEDGTQGFIAINEEDWKFDDNNLICYSRKTVMEQPLYFKKLTPKLWNKMVNFLIKK